MRIYFTIFNKIITNKIVPKPQTGTGSFHKEKDLPKILTGTLKLIKYKKMTDFEIIDAIEKVRTKNNINWMNILRLAFKHAPSEARDIVKNQ